MFRHRTSSDHGEPGAAPILLLFALSAFSVLSVAALSTALGGAPAGSTFNIFKTIPRDSLTHFIASMVVPNEWRTPGAQGAFQFQLPVVVPETGSAESGAVSAWHPMTELPGVSVCCEARPGSCAPRRSDTGDASIEDWTPAADDALRVAFDLRSSPDSDPAKGDLVTATVSSWEAAAAAEGSSVACRLVFDGQVIAKGTAMLRQEARPDTTVLTTDLIVGSMTLAVRTK